MKIEHNDIAEVKAVLNNNIQAGMGQLLFYEDREYLKPYDMSCCENWFDAEEEIWLTEPEQNLTYTDIRVALDTVDHIEKQSKLHPQPEYTITWDLDKIGQQLMPLQTLFDSDHDENVNTMKKDNLTTVKETAKYSGFGDALDKTIEENVKNGVHEFTAIHTPGYGKNVEATAYFSKSTEGNYFMNKFDLEINKGLPNAFKQTFYINGPELGTIKLGNGEVEQRWVNSDFTLREAFNLAMGRSVRKEFTKKPDAEGIREIYAAWARIDFMAPKINGNHKIVKDPDYDMIQKLSGYAVKERFLPTAQEDLYEPLARGNRVPVTFPHMADKARYFVEANSEFKTFNFFKDSIRVGHHLLKNEAAEKQQQSIAPAVAQNTVVDDKKKAKAAKVENGKQTPAKKTTKRKKGISK